MKSKKKYNLRKNRKKMRSKKQKGGSSKDVTLHILLPENGRTPEEQNNYFKNIKTQIGNLNEKTIKPNIYILNKNHIYPQGTFVFKKPTIKTRNTKKIQLNKNIMEVNLLLKRRVKFFINKKYLTQIERESFPENTHGYNSDFIIDNSNYNTNDLFIVLNTNKKITVNNTNSLEYIKTYLALKDNRYFMTTTINEMPANESGYSQLNNKIHKVYSNGKADGILRKNDLILQSGGAAANKLPSLNCFNEYDNFKTQFKTLIEKYNTFTNKETEKIVITEKNLQTQLENIIQKFVNFFPPKYEHGFTIENKGNNIFENKEDYEQFKKDYEQFKNLKKIDSPININIKIYVDVNKHNNEINKIKINNISTQELITDFVNVFNIQNKYCINEKYKYATKLFKIMNQVLLQFKEEIEEQIEKRNEAEPIIPKAPKNNKLSNNSNLSNNNSNDEYSANNEYSSNNNNIITKAEIYRDPVERYYDRFAPYFDENKGGPQLTQEYDPRNLNTTTSGNLSYHFNAPSYLYNFFDY